MHMFIMILVAVLVYFLPAMIAMYRNHLNAAAIFMTNFLLGWTIIGWIVALIWALTNSPATAARQTSKFLKFTFALIVAFILLIAWILMPHKIADHSTGTMQAPVVRTGVPVPADEIFGK